MLIDLSTITWSLPAEKSVLTTIAAFWPAATPAMVSLSVWVLPSIWPAVKASIEAT